MKNPRMSLAVEKPIYNAIHDLADKEGVSMSTVVRDLLKEALEIREDVTLSKFAEDREKTLDISNTLTHEQVWG
jgi:hypothetical protein